MCVDAFPPPPHIANPNALFFATLSSHSWVHPKDIREPVHDPSLPAGWEVGFGLQFQMAKHNLCDLSFFFFFFFFFFFLFVFRHTSTRTDQHFTTMRAQAKRGAVGVLFLSLLSRARASASPTLHLFPPRTYFSTFFLSRPFLLFSWKHPNKVEGAYSTKYHHTSLHPPLSLSLARTNALRCSHNAHHPPLLRLLTFSRAQASFVHDRRPSS